MNGIKLQYSYGNNVTNNIYLDNFYGNYLYYSSKNSLKKNSFLNNDIGIYLKYSIWNKIINNDISNSDNSIQLLYSNNNTITRNNILNNRDGILLTNSNNNTITKNNLTNYKICIYLYNSCYNKIFSCNKFSNNYETIKIRYKSDNNHIYHNNFIKNTRAPIDECNNIWDDGKYGNYWSDYKVRYPKAKRIWQKGIWDTPYEMEDGDNKDNCPLIKQWPNSASIDIQRNKANDNSLFLRFLERFPLLQRLLYIWRGSIE
jgi:parallel beta-helix repeat protein